MHVRHFLEEHNVPGSLVLGGANLVDMESEWVAPLESNRE
jgi:hypothetical protein